MNLLSSTLIFIALPFVALADGWTPPVSPEKVSASFASDGWNLVSSSSNIDSGKLLLITYWRENLTSKRYARCFDVRQGAEMISSSCELSYDQSAIDEIFKKAAEGTQDN